MNRSVPVSYTHLKDFEVVYTEFDYRTNDTDEVRWLAVGVDGDLVCEGCHDAGTLSCTVTVSYTHLDVYKRQVADA